MTEYILDEDKVVKFNMEMFPKFGWCCIMAGGAGSGKGWQLKHLVPIQGRKFDPDSLKEYNLNFWHVEEHEIADDELVLDDGSRYSLEDIGRPYNMTNKKFTSLVHQIVRPQVKRFKNHILQNARENAPDGRLPNLIFDVTMSEVSDYESLLPILKEIGYKIAIVYVFTDFDRAYQQNNTRDRRVSDEIMFSTHKGMLESFKAIMKRPDLVAMLDDAWVILTDLKDAVKVFSVKDGDKIVFPEKVRDLIDDFINNDLKLIRKREYEYSDKKVTENFITGNSYFDEF